MKFWIRTILLSLLSIQLFNCENSATQPVVGGTASIEFHIDDLGVVTLKIHDRYNALIYMQTTDSLNPGTHAITWGFVDTKGQKVNEGIYFYTLFLNDSQIDTPKPILCFSSGGY